MIPKLSQEWAAVYFHVAVVLLTFGLGVPALLIDLTVEEELRHVLHRRLRLGRWAGLTGIFVVIVLFFVWIAHPGDGESTDPFISLLGSLIISALVVVTCFSWWFLMVTYRRGQMVKRLRQRLMQTVRKAGRPEESSLDDLAYLGEHGAAGLEKVQVLDVLDEVVIAIIRHPSYRGYSLEQVVLCVESTVHASRMGNNADYARAAEILRSILVNLKQQTRMNSPDIEVAMRAVWRLGLSAARQRVEGPLLSLIETASWVGRHGRPDLASRSLFGLGAEALSTKDFVAAEAALISLESTTSEVMEASSEITRNLIGLLARFSAAGTSANQRSKIYLGAETTVFKPSFSKCREAAVAYFASSGDYTTADMVTILSE